jgi:DNA helicase-2/ATP-dependent DNA helicase PcrA
LDTQLTGKTPAKRPMKNGEGGEEERRLFYVAITRAKNELYLSHPLMRAGYGSTGMDALQQPSRFLSEIPGALLNEWNLRSRYS